MAAKKKQPASRRAKPAMRLTTSATRNGYGWTPDVPDFRDHMYGAVRPPPRALPHSVDLRGQASAVEDQGQLGSCTANALVGALEFLEGQGGQEAIDLSRLFIYYNERVIEHTVQSDSGAMLRDGIKTLAKQGVCSEAEWPYIVAQFAKQPPIVCYRDAAEHTIASYQRLNTVDEMRACLAEGFPFVFGFAVYESFESAAVSRTGVVPMPTTAEKAVGGHAVCAVGYDDAAKRFLVRNSWGIGWGMKGYCTIPYDYLGDRNLSDDFWTIRK